MQYSRVDVHALARDRFIRVLAIQKELMEVLMREVGGRVLAARQLSGNANLQVSTLANASEVPR